MTSLEPPRSKRYTSTRKQPLSLPIVTVICQIPCRGSRKSPGKNNPGGSPSGVAIRWRRVTIGCMLESSRWARMTAVVRFWFTDVATHNLVPCFARQCPRLALKGPAEITPSVAFIRPAVSTHPDGVGRTSGDTVRPLFAFGSEAVQAPNETASTPHASTPPDRTRCMMWTPSPIAVACACQATTARDCGTLNDFDDRQSQPADRSVCGEPRSTAIECDVSSARQGCWKGIRQQRLPTWEQIRECRPTGWPGLARILLDLNDGPRRSPRPRPGLSIAGPAAAGPQATACRGG